MLALLEHTKDWQEPYLLIRVTILEEVCEIFRIFQTGSLAPSTINMERTCSVQNSPSLNLFRQHLLEITLHLAKNSVLSQLDSLVDTIDGMMPYSASSIALPGLLLLYRYEHLKPKRAMQILEPECLTEFKKDNLKAARKLLEQPLEKWRSGRTLSNPAATSSQFSQATKQLLMSCALEASFVLYHFAGVLLEQ